MVTIVSADGLALDSARPSAGTVVMVILAMISSNILQQIIHLYRLSQINVMQDKMSPDKSAC